MKKILLSIVLSALFIACGKESDSLPNKEPENLPDLTAIIVKEYPCDTLNYIGRIGDDFDSALDSLRSLKNISSGISTVPLEVLFDFDNRKFYGIIYGDCGIYTDVLDTKGNYFLRSYYNPDQEDTGIKEESIFNENKSFTINNGSATMRYEGRIGNDFDSALDSLKILYKQTLEFYGEDGYNIKKEKIIVDFNYDDRAFFLLTFIDKKNINNWLITGIVIDEKGNYFYVTWNED